MSPDEEELKKLKEERDAEIAEEYRKLIRQTEGDPADVQETKISEWLESIKDAFGRKGETE